MFRLLPRRGASWQRTSHDRASSRSGLDRKFATELFCAMRHNSQSQAGALLHALRQTVSIILDSQCHRAVPLGQDDLNMMRFGVLDRVANGLLPDAKKMRRDTRSEEHTSELQSR